MCVCLEERHRTIPLNDFPVKSMGLTLSSAHDGIKFVTCRNEDRYRKDCPRDATKRRLQSQQQPSRSIWEVVETAGSTRKIEDIREADFRLANRCAGEFEAVKHSVSH